MIRSDRCIPLSAHVTEEVRDALEAEAAHKGRSVSATVYHMLAAQLRRLGHHIDPHGETTKCKKTV
jgi:hypothetical protein